MQRSRFFTATRSEIGSETHDARDALARFPWIPAFALLLVAGFGGLIAAHPNTPMWDQAQLLEARFEGPHVPSPPFGFTSQLLVCLLRPFAADVAALHTLLRFTAMALWAGGAVWLATGMLERRGLQAALLLALFSSQYPFLWLSTELIAGGLLCLVLAAWVRSAPAWVTGALLALFALAKPDLLLVAFALFGVFVWQRRDHAVPLALGVAATAALLLLPGLVAFGPDYLTAYGSDGGGRAFGSFSQHLAALLAPLQLAPGPNPWAEPQPYVNRLFPDADSFAAVVLQPGLPYLDFVGLSLAMGVRKAGYVFQWAWLAVPLVIFLRKRAGLTWDANERAVLVTAVGVIPFVLLAYPHIRYFARYYPLFWIALLCSTEKLAALGEARRPKAGLIAVGLVLLLAVAENVERASLGLALADRLDPYWFPD